MLNQALVFVNKTLDRYLINYFGLDQSITLLNNLIEQSGSVAKENQNKLVVSLVNLEYESAKQFYGGIQQSSASRIEKVNPPIRFNVDLMFSANFDDYEEALKFLTATLTFFQANNCLNHENFPEIPQGLEALRFDVESLSYRETHELWSAMGARYRPSILYKMRHITVQARELREIVTPLADVTAEVRVR